MCMGKNFPISPWTKIDCLVGWAGTLKRTCPSAIRFQPGAHHDDAPISMRTGGEHDDERPMVHHPLHALASAQLHSHSAYGLHRSVGTMAGTLLRDVAKDALGSLIAGLPQAG